jgi:hypothetical protein
MSDTFLGLDRSGNDNNWTVNNMTLAADQMLDSPTNNFATLNPVSGEGSNALSEGNLKVANVSGGASGWTETAPSTFILPTTGKWYWEWQLVDCAGEVSQGSVIATATNSIGAGTSGILDLRTNNGSAGTIGLDGVDNVQTGLAIAAEDDIFAIAVDCVNETFQGYLNGSAFGTSVDYSGVASNKKNNLVFRPMVTSSGHNVTFIANFGQDSSFAGTKTAQGNQDDNSIGDFYYDVPTDYLALCTSNLPAVAVVPSEHFKSVEYNDGAGAKTGVGFQPDLVWLKSKGNNYHHKLTDAVRGVTKALSSSSTDDESTDSTGLTAFGADGFTVGADTNYSDTGGGGYYGSTAGMAGWCWKAGNAISGTGDFTQGTIASTCSRNVDAGFSIVSYTGTGASATIGHGLSKAPEMIIIKCRSADSTEWIVGHDSLATNAFSNNKFLKFDDASTYTNGLVWGSQPTSTVFQVTTGDAGNLNTSGETFVAYCFHSVDGYSKFGVYTGNGNADGTFVYTGFKPEYVMVRRTNASLMSWRFMDTTRYTYNNSSNVGVFTINNAAQEYNVLNDDLQLDICANGFKHRHTYSQVNHDGSPHIYMAFAETPFKYSNAR